MSQVLLPYQQDFIGEAFLGVWSLVLWEKSRRVGITWCAAQYAPIHAARGASDVWYIGYKEDLGREFISQCAEATESYQRALDKAHLVGHFSTLSPEKEQTLAGLSAVETFSYDDSEYDGDGRLIGDKKGILAYRITFRSGRRIGALTSSPRNLRGLGGIAIIDEASFHDDLDGLIKAAMAFMIWGGRVIVISTHMGVDNPFNVLVNEVRAKKIPGFVGRLTFDEAVSQGLYRRICEVNRTEHTAENEAGWVAGVYSYYGVHADEELRVIPARSGSKYLGSAMVEACMYDAPVVRLEYDADFLERDLEDREAEVSEWCEVVLGPLLGELSVEYESALGEDFGRVSDLSVFCPVVTEKDLRRRIPFLVELRQVPHNQQWQVLRYICDRLPHLRSIWMDAGGSGSALAESAYDEYGGGVVERIHLSQKWYAEHLPVLKGGIEERHVMIPSDIDVRNDLMTFEMINGIPKLPNAKNKAANGMPRHGDSGIAIAMGYCASVDADGLNYIKGLAQREQSGALSFSALFRR